MSYAIYILRRAQKELAQLPSNSYTRVRDAVRDLGGNLWPRGCRKLAGRDAWRIRIGNYRVIYEIDDIRKVITVVHVGHRRDIYR